MTPYITLKNAVRQLGGCTTAGEVRREFLTYLAWIRKPSKPIIVLTREEYWESLQRKKKKGTKRGRKKKGDADPVLLAYDSIDDVRVEAKRHSPMLDVEYAEDFKWLDQLRDKHQKEIDDDGYNAEF